MSQMSLTDWLWYAGTIAFLAIYFWRVKKGLTHKGCCGTNQDKSHGRKD